jgi:hypothetical protein
MNEFDRAKERYEKRKKVVPISKEPKPQYKIEITVYDGLNEYRLAYDLPSLTGTVVPSKRNEKGYREVIEPFLHKEFGRWRLIPPQTSHS